MRPRSSLPSLVLNIPAIARRGSDEVEALLGRPDAPDGPQVSLQVKRTYQRGRVEVVFVDDHAHWIKLYECRDLVFDRSALPKLGLPPLRPTYRNPDHVISWTNIPRLQEVSLYAGRPGKVSSVIACVETTKRDSTPARARDGFRRRWPAGRPANAGSTNP